MRTPEFMIDTANLDDIERIWAKLDGAGVLASSIRGITTNPNALSKINCTTIADFETTVYKLTRFLTRIGAKQSTLHIQMPQSKMSDNELDMWVAYIKQLGDGRTRLTLKISPYAQTLEQIRTTALAHIPLNVTGVADAATAFRCLSHPVNYVSIIPGRMEEVGIDASSHLKILNQRFGHFTGTSGGGKLITGSMRTIDGLRRAIDHQTVPTIGIRVWDLMTDDDYLGFAGEWWDCAPFEPNYLTDIPLIDQRNIDLTQQFFEQMDTLGKPLYDEFVTGLCK